MLPSLMSLDFCCDIQMVGSDFCVNNMKVWIHPLVPIEQCLNTTAYLSIVTDHVHPFMTILYPSSDGLFSRITCHVTKLKSYPNRFQNMTMSSLCSNDLHSHQGPHI